MAHSHIAYAPGASLGRARVSFAGHVLATLKAVVSLVQNRRAALRLADLDDRMLDDLGITYSDVNAARGLPLWTDPTQHLSDSRGRHFNLPRQ